MFFYIFLCCTLLLLSFSCSKSKNLYISIDLRIVVFLILFLPAALRLNIGTDYKNYVSIFNQLQYGHEIRQEFGWKLINIFVIRNSLSVQWIFVISSFLIYTFAFATDKKDLWIVMFVYFLYLYTSSYNAVRNAISISLFWFSYIWLLKGKRLKGFFFVIFASLFHASAYLYIPVYLMMCFFKMNKKITILLGLGIYILLTKLHFAQLIMNSALFGTSKYAKYLFSEKYNSATVTNSGFGVLLRHFYIFFIYSLCDERKCSKREFSAISICFLAILASDILMTQIFIFYRLLEIVP